MRFRSLFAALQQFLLVYTSHHKELASSSQQALLYSSSIHILIILQLFGQLRESLQEYNIDEILLKFVKEKGTGREPPGNFNLFSLIIIFNHRSYKYGSR